MSPNDGVALSTVVGNLTGRFMKVVLGWKTIGRTPYLVSERRGSDCQSGTVWPRRQAKLHVTLLTHVGLDQWPEAPRASVVATWRVYDLAGSLCRRTRNS